MAQREEYPFVCRPVYTGLWSNGYDVAFARRRFRVQLSSGKTGDVKLPAGPYIYNLDSVSFFPMKFKIPKKYGSSKTTPCPFCQRIATLINQQGMEVCRLHAQETLPEIKCICGSWLELCSGKFGPYFNCLKCGNINFKKGMELQGRISPQKKEAVKEETKPTTAREKKEITITSNDPRYFD